MLVTKTDVLDYADCGVYGEFADYVGFAFSAIEGFLLSEKDINLLTRRIRSLVRKGVDFGDAYEKEIEPFIRQKESKHRADIDAVQKYYDTHNGTLIPPEYRSDDLIEELAYRVRHYIDDLGLEYCEAIPAAEGWYDKLYGEHIRYVELVTTYLSEMNIPSSDDYVHSLAYIAERLANGQKVVTMSADKLKHLFLESIEEYWI